MLLRTEAINPRMQIYIKDPEAILTYAIDWSATLSALGTGVTIADSEWSVPDGLTMEDEAHSVTSASIKLSGGTVNTSNTVYNKITTSAGDVDRRAIQVLIRDASTISEPGEFATALAAIRAVLQDKASKDQEQYSIAGRQLKRYSIPDLLALENRFTTLANSEARGSSSAPFLRNVQVRFTNPR